MFFIEKRKIKIVTGKKTQTINVYIDNESPGKYNPRLRIGNNANFIKEQFLVEKGFDSIQMLVNFLLEEHGARLDTESSPSYEKFESQEFDSPENEQWIESVLPEFEDAVNQLVDEFMENPYKHRVEHSLHCELYFKLAQRSSFNKLIDFKEFKIGYIHKEWPETVPRYKDGKNRKGNFDLAIIAPPNKDTSLLSVEDFKKGLNPASVAFVVELGLDYELTHLEDDFSKLRNSKVKHGYLIHFARERISRPQHGVREYVEKIIKEEKNSGPRIAYVNIGNKQISFRRLGEPGITVKPSK